MGQISGVIAARQCTDSLTVWCRFELNALGFDCYSRSLEKGGNSWIWVEELPAPSCCFPTPPHPPLLQQISLQEPQEVSCKVCAKQTYVLMPRFHCSAQCLLKSATNTLSGASVHVNTVRCREPRNTSFQVGMFWKKDM